MKKNPFLFLLICFCISFSHAQNFNPKKSNLDSFLKIATEKSKFDWITIEAEFPKNWITEKDIYKLVEILDSKKKSKCTMSIFSSTIPTEDSELGGFAIIFIESFKDKKVIDLGLYRCPKTNSKKVQEILSWWKNYNKH